MFLFGTRKKEEGLYPGFINRILSSVIDIGLATVIIIPICAVIYGIIYDGIPPSKELGKIITESYQNAKTFQEANKNLQASADYKNFMIHRGYLSIFFEQLIQVSLLASMILLCWIRTQSTPGKMLLSMKIVDNDTMGKPTIIQYLLRLFGYIISVLPLGLGIVYVMLNKKRRAFHDIIAGTVVISVKHLNKK